MAVEMCWGRRSWLLLRVLNGFFIITGVFIFALLSLVTL